GDKLGCEFSIVQESDDSAAQGIAIMVGNNESVVQMADTLATAREGNDRFSSEHVVQQLHRMTGALGPGYYANISQRKITREIFQHVRRYPDDRARNSQFRCQLPIFFLLSFRYQCTNQQ